MEMNTVVFVTLMHFSSSKDYVMSDVQMIFTSRITSRMQTFIFLLSINPRRGLTRFTNVEQPLDDARHSCQKQNRSK